VRLPPVAVAEIVTDARFGACFVQSRKLTAKIVSVHDVKVSEVSLPEMVVALEAVSTSASKNDWAHVTVPAGVRKVAGSAVVFLKVRGESNAPPGSVRRAVVAEADAEPSARRPSAAIAASAANLRIDMMIS
jgi:hypothetical protein